ncbi:MAG: tetratricopeptide repeat protein, partial [Phycisphaeraceae bacterium]|nr:tetratricopeptide repeat protein [Phycisphaeraceae bacterium]
LAGAYLQLGRAAEAIPYAKKATELEPSNQAGWSNLAAAYSLTSQFDKAIEAYRQAVELGSPQEPIILGLADAHIRLGHYDRAIETLRNFTLQNKPSGTAYERLAFAQFKLRHFDEALSSYQASLSINEKDTAALNGLGACLMTLYIQGNRIDKTLHRDALEAWRKSLRYHPQQPKIIDLISRYQRL